MLENFTYYNLAKIGLFIEAAPRMNPLIYLLVQAMQPCFRYPVWQDGKVMTEALSFERRGEKIMAEQTSAALHKKAHNAAETGDMETLTNMMAEDIVWHSFGKSLIAGDYHGRDAVMGQFFGKMAELSDGSAGFKDVQHYFGSGDYSAAFFHWTATRNGQIGVFPVCEVIRWRDGQIVEDWGFVADQYGWDAFWS